MDLSMFFGKKRQSPKRKETKECGVIVIRNKERKVYVGSKGACYYKTKSGKTYVDKKRVKMHKKSPKRKSPKRKSPKRKSPKRKSPKRKSPKGKKTKYGYGLGQPSLMEMMGPAGLTFIPAPVSAMM